MSLFPPLALDAFIRRSILPVEYINGVESIAPGFTAAREKAWRSRFDAQLRKRYGVATQGTTLPFGTNAPPLTSSGTLPPSVSLGGTPVVGSIEIVIQITTGGATGTAIFQWSQDAGQTWTSGVVTAASVTLTGTGLTANLPAAGTFSTDNIYTAPTPVPEVILGWLTAVLNRDVMRKRGANPNDPQIQLVIDDATTALAELEKAANSRDGLYDLPIVDGQDSAVTTAGPLWYTEASPYAGADVLEQQGRCEDANGVGTYGGTGSSGPSGWPSSTGPCGPQSFP
jgi:hypothetical protein